MIRAAAETFQVQEEEGAPSFNWNRPVEKIAGPLKVTVVCLEDHTERIVMVAAHLLTHTTWGSTNRFAKWCHKRPASP